MRILAIDPGTTESGYVLRDTENADSAAITKGIGDNEHIKSMLINMSVEHIDLLLIEMIASYGMAVGKDVFETCVWIGQFMGAHERWVDGKRVYRPVARMTRSEVRQVLTGKQSGVTDSVVSQRCKDIYAPGVRNHGKGTKDNPGYFYGFSKDIWQAFALSEAYCQREGIITLKPEYPTQ